MRSGRRSNCARLVQLPISSHCPKPSGTRHGTWIFLIGLRRPLRLLKLAPNAALKRGLGTGCPRTDARGTISAGGRVARGGRRHAPPGLLAGFENDFQSGHRS